MPSGPQKLFELTEMETTTSKLKVRLAREARKWLFKVRASRRAGGNQLPDLERQRQFPFMELSQLGPWGESGHSENPSPSRVSKPFQLQSAGGANFVVTPRKRRQTDTLLSSC